MKVKRYSYRSKPAELEITNVRLPSLNDISFMSRRLLEQVKEFWISDSVSNQDQMFYVDNAVWSISVDKDRLTPVYFVVEFKTREPFERGDEFDLENIGGMRCFVLREDVAFVERVVSMTPNVNKANDMLNIWAETFKDPRQLKKSHPTPVYGPISRAVSIDDSCSGDMLVYGTLSCKNGRWYIFGGSEYSNEPARYYEVDKDTVCRSVGYSDATGYMLYDGDTVKLRPFYESYKVSLLDERTAGLVKSDGSVLCSLEDCDMSLVYQCEYPIPISRLCDE